MTNYNEASKTYDETRRSDASIIEMMNEMNVFQKGKKVLDFGCGTGNYIYEIANKFECSIYGLEPSEGMREKAIKKNSNIKIINGSHTDIPFESNMFDFVYMTDVIHHIVDINELFKNLNRVIMKDGLICIVTESWKQIENRWYNEYFPSLENNEKKRYPDLVDITYYGKQNGFYNYKTDIKVHNTYKIDKYFMKMVEEKNYSMFRMLNANEFNDGLEKMKKDEGKTVTMVNSGESLLWLKKK